MKLFLTVGWQNVWSDCALRSALRALREHHASLSLENAYPLLLARSMLFTTDRDVAAAMIVEQRGLAALGYRVKLPVDVSCPGIGNTLGGTDEAGKSTPKGKKPTLSLREAALGECHGILTE